MNENERPFVTVVSGLPRSGTSMMMQMIEAGGITAMTDNLRTADDDNPKGYFELEAVKKTKTESSWLNEAVGKVVKIIYLLLYDLPDNFNYRVVFMNRRIEEVLASQSKMLERRGETGASVDNEKLKLIFAAQLEKSRKWLKQQKNFDVQFVNYHDVVQDPLAESKAIAEFLGGQVDVDAMSSAVTDKLYRQRS